ncbi:MAG TPA: AarF/ABC1/UbiB kinase family protein [Alphaproteobacteria bacterium]|jgi:predicted unusual protein kinase regulating ubiquinone biosynthesis (AarF/ABC1/UbiB family)
MSNGENNSFGGRLGRYVRVGRAVGGLAARAAGQRYLGLKVDRERDARQLKEALGGLKGPLMKVAQLLSTIPDALPKEYVTHLSELQANAPAMGWPFVRRRMTAELGEGWERKFKRFEHTAARAASLGQVHRAEGPNGAVLACKLQYPDMASTVEADLRQLKIIFRLYERYDRAISTENIHAEISERLREELDYAREAKHMRLYRHMLRGEKGVHVPEPVDALSTRRLLTMNWIEGRPLADFAEAPAELRNALAHNMFRAWYVPFYEYGVIHGDPHLGNYTARPDRSINLLDFGCIRVFPPAFVKGVIDLYFALRDGKPELAIEAYRIWGFTDLRKDVVDTLNIWAHYVYAPLMRDRTQAIQEDNSTRYGAEVAGKVHAALRKIGGVKPPREFVLMDRAAIGLGSVFMRLKAEINWYRLFHELIHDFDVKALAKRQKDALAKAEL